MRKPNPVNKIPPNTCNNKIATTCHHCSLIIFSNTSPENAENVVKLPKNPVTKKSFTDGESIGKVIKILITIPITKQPSQFASKVPKAKDENNELKANDNPQRLVAPKDAPQITNNNDCIISLTETMHVDKPRPIHHDSNQYESSAVMLVLNEDPHSP